LKPVRDSTTAQTATNAPVATSTRITSRRSARVEITLAHRYVTSTKLAKNVQVLTTSLITSRSEIRTTLNTTETPIARQKAKIGPSRPVRRITVPRWTSSEPTQPPTTSRTRSRYGSRSIGSAPGSE
jgi:hypothetical protein